MNDDAAKPAKRPPRPARPSAHPTPDGVSAGMRRAGGYAWRALAIGLVTIGLLWAIAPLQNLLLGLFFALLFGAWLLPLTNALARRIPRWAAAVVALLLFVVGLVLVVVFIGLSAANQWEGIGVAFRQGITDLDHWLRSGPLQLNDANFASMYTTVENYIKEYGGSIALGVLSGLGNVLGIATVLAASFFVLIFLLVQPREMFGWLVSWLPERNREVLAQSMLIGWRSFSEYSRGILIVAASNAVLVTILLLVLQVPLAVPLGVIVFFGAFIPYIGAPIAMFLAAFVALVTNGPLAGALVIVLIFVVGQIEGNVLQPLIMGHSVELHPVAIVLVTAAAAAYFGLIGALIGVPIAASAYGIAKYLQDR